MKRQKAGNRRHMITLRIHINGPDDATIQRVIENTVLDTCGLIQLTGAAGPARLITSDQLPKEIVNRCTFEMQRGYSKFNAD